MLRECHRVLRDGGRLASVVIEPAPGLDADQLARARELGPGSMTVRGTLALHTVEAGFTVLAVEDWTGELRALLTTLLDELARREADMRAVEGADVYEHERGKKEALLEGVEAGLLVRTLVVAAR